jgi:hypothetical protein
MLKTKQIRWFYIWTILLVLGQAVSASPVEQNTSMAQADAKTESPKPATPEKSLTIFLMVGIIINIIMFSIFIVWAVKEWQKK